MAKNKGFIGIIGFFVVFSGSILFYDGFNSILLNIYFNTPTKKLIGGVILLLIAYNVFNIDVRNRLK